MLHMQIAAINISLQHYCYKSLDNVCPYFTVWEENLCFSPSRKILLYSLFLLDVTLENRLYRYFCVAAMIMMLIYASKCVTLVCNHTNIAWIWNWYRVVTEADNCLFLVEARPEVCVGSVGYQRQWWKFPVIFLVKTYIPQCSHSV